LPANLPTTGNARLTIAYASNDHAQQWIYVNNENTLFTSYYPDNGDGNAFIRQTNYAKYTYKQVLIPMNKLVTGTNTITLGMPSNSAWVSHLMYDYISLEASVPTLSPSVAIAASATTICAGTSVTFTATPVNGGTAPVYQWKINGNNVGTNSNTFTTTNLANSNVVSCVLTSNATNVITNTATSNSITITVNTLPAKPTVAWDGVQLSVPSTYTTYQWLLNNVTVSNATTNNYKPVNSGYYQAAVTNAAGCKAVSDSFAVTITAIANPATSGTASVYPNPSNGNITVDLGFNPSTTINLVIISSTGNHIKTIQTNNRKTSIATTELATGVYYIKVSSGVYNRLLPFTVN